MELTQTKLNEVKVNGTKPKQMKTNKIRWTMPLEEAQAMIADWLKSNYGLSVHVDDVNRSGDTLVITGDPKGKG